MEKKRSTILENLNRNVEKINELVLWFDYEKRREEIANHIKLLNDSKIVLPKDVFHFHMEIYQKELLDIDTHQNKTKRFTRENANEKMEQYQDLVKVYLAQLSTEFKELAPAPAKKRVSFK